MFCVSCIVPAIKKHLLANHDKIVAACNESITAYSLKYPVRYSGADVFIGNWVLREDGDKVIATYGIDINEYESSELKLYLEVSHNHWVVVDWEVIDFF